ncbi:MAG TPA: GIY-YIG nuclease family protein [archaeon]|nr:GIY-YIG nuclease family protein [archaeon]
MPYFVYLLECRDGSYYCGFTKNVAARLSAHNKGTGAKYTRARRPVKLVYFEGKKTLKTAMRRELEIKSFPHSRKRAMIASRAM